MALTHFPRRICNLIAADCRAGGESDVAGGTALNELLGGGRVSGDIDLFHDTEESPGLTWDADRRLLEAEGMGLKVLRERPGSVEARVRRGEDTVLLQWSRDGAFRFLPPVESAEFGLLLHPFDPATKRAPARSGTARARC